MEMEMKMAMEQQQKEWAEAQKIEISMDLVVAAKQHLKFLEAVDKNAYLYEGAALERAIYRYNVYWLPLLAKHSESPVTKGPLVVPLDCEWVWHCHRLNPEQYLSDCKSLFGRILDNSNVVSSIQEADKKMTEEIWIRLYPEESYELDVKETYGEGIAAKDGSCTKYDLVSAVKRQSHFFTRVSQPHMSSDMILEGAVARYKGFLHLIRKKKDEAIKVTYVPTLDVDLIWHTHQLHPASYCKDLSILFGKILQHDDDVSDKSKRERLDIGFSITKTKWEETYGMIYKYLGVCTEHHREKNNMLCGGKKKSGECVVGCIENHDGKEIGEIVKSGECLIGCIENYNGKEIDEMVESGECFWVYQNYDGKEIGEMVKSGDCMIRCVANYEDKSDNNFMSNASGNRDIIHVAAA